MPARTGVYSIALRILGDPGRRRGRRPGRVRPGLPGARRDGTARGSASSASTPGWRRSSSTPRGPGSGGAATTAARASLTFLDELDHPDRRARPRRRRPGSRPGRGRPRRGRAALLALPERYRAPIVLRHVDGLGYDEIAARPRPARGHGQGAGPSRAGPAPRDARGRGRSTRCRRRPIPPATDAGLASRRGPTRPTPRPHPPGDPTDDRPVHASPTDDVLAGHLGELRTAAPDTLLPRTLIDGRAGRRLRRDRLADRPAVRRVQRPRGGRRRAGRRLARPSRRDMSSGYGRPAYRVAALPGTARGGDRPTPGRRSPGPDRARPARPHARSSATSGRRRSRSRAARSGRTAGSPPRSAGRRPSGRSAPRSATTRCRSSCRATGSSGATG